eukprot:bmy_11152T0
MAKHLKFIARTVMVQEGNVEGAYRTLNRASTPTSTLVKAGPPGRCIEFIQRFLSLDSTLGILSSILGYLESARILTMDGLIEDIKRRRYYEKPCRRRQRESYETCRRIYNMEMARKINFLMRKNRADPWQGC